VLLLGKPICLLKFGAGLQWQRHLQHVDGIGGLRLQLVRVYVPAAPAQPSQLSWQRHILWQAS